MLRLLAVLFALVALPCLLAHPALATRCGGKPPGGGRPAKTPQQHRPAARPTLPTFPTVSSASPTQATVAPVEADSPRLAYLTGVVLAPDGRPCPGVCVFPSNAPRQIVVTNAKGEFQLAVPVHTAVSLQAELLGKGSGRVTIAGESAQPVRIILER